MEYDVAKLQEIVQKVQYYSKLNFRNAIDIELVLETDGLEELEINKLISAGVRTVAFSTMDNFIRIEPVLLPCRKIFDGPVSGQNLTPILANFNRIESITEITDVRKISEENLRSGKVTDLMVRLNIISTIRQFGFLPAEIDGVCLEIARQPGVRLIGIHTYIPPLQNQAMTKTAMRKAGTIFKMLKNRFRGVERLSINYLGHFDDLIAEGANDLRIGVKDLA